MTCRRCQISVPHFLGMMHRHKEIIKLVSDIKQSNLGMCESLIEKWHGHWLESSAMTTATLVQWLTDVSTSFELRISIDFDLASNQPLPRLGFEILTAPGPTQPGTLTTSNANLIDNFQVHVPPSLHQRPALTDWLRQLPFAQQRPAANMVDTERMSIRHYHRKMSLEPCTLSIKDYVGLYGEVLEQRLRWPWGSGGAEKSCEARSTLRPLAPGPSTQHQHEYRLAFQAKVSRPQSAPQGEIRFRRNAPAL
jgi:hypothetical protein